MEIPLKRAAVAGVVAVVIAGAGMLGFAYSGVYDIGADAPHTKPVFALLETIRERSIKTHAQTIIVPNLNDEALVLKGAGQYAAMCTSCHLTPGEADSELRSGLYPQPPNLALAYVEPKEAFWVIKHGIKMTAMPAWGKTHDDTTIWSMVAFLERLPTLTPAQYKALVAKAPPDEDMGMSRDSHHAHNNHD